MTKFNMGNWLTGSNDFLLYWRILPHSLGSEILIHLLSTFLAHCHPPSFWETNNASPTLLWSCMPCSCSPTGNAWLKMSTQKQTRHNQWVFLKWGWTEEIMYCENNYLILIQLIVYHWCSKRRAWQAMVHRVAKSWTWLKLTYHACMQTVTYII